MMLYVIIIINLITYVIAFNFLYKKLSMVNMNVSEKYCRIESFLRKFDVVMNEWLSSKGKELKCCDGFNYRIYPTSDKYYHESERKKELERVRTKQYIEGTFSNIEEIKKLLTDNIIKEEKKKMKCCKCGKKLDHTSTYIKMENATDKNLNKFLAVCNDCAYGMINKGAEINPIFLQEN